MQCYSRVSRKKLGYHAHLPAKYCARRPVPVSPSALRRDGRGGDWFMRDVRVGLGVCWLREEGEEGDRGVNRSEPSESVSESQEGVVVAAGVDTDVGVDIIIATRERVHQPP